ncbi:MAG: hypothetical protein IJI41_14625 [Anaerolineaceae bacterium]|nr:hypothetical protein [Anaerolineaceae bacterium]
MENNTGTWRRNHEAIGRKLWFSNRSGMFLCLIVVFFFFFFFMLISAEASDVVSSGYYRPERDPSIPDRLYVGWVMDCGDYSVKLLQQPVITKSNNHLVADKETEYMVLRFAITNKTDASLGWLAPNTFQLQDTYLGRIYGTYAMDIGESCKVASGYHEQVFYSEIKPKDTLYTSVVFSVYPDVESWIMIFAPHTFGEEPKETVRFQIPIPVHLN